MHVTKTLTSMAIFILFVGGCGSSTHTLQVNFSPGTGITQTSDPFKDPAVLDVILVLNNLAPTSDVTDSSGKVVIPRGKILDANGDNVADNLVYPTNCTASAPPTCGFPPNADNFNLSDIPLNYRFTLTVRFRNNNGTPLYEGTSAAFDNIESNTTAVSVVINKVP